MPDEIEWTDEDEEAATRAWAKVTGQTTSSESDEEQDEDEAESES